jgi:hypothetical protein
VDGNSLDTEFAAGALDAQCDLGPVGDDDLVEHVLADLGYAARRKTAQL